MTKRLLLVALAIVLAGCATHNGGSTTSTSTTSPPVSATCVTPVDGRCANDTVTTPTASTTTTTTTTPTPSTTPTTTTTTPPTTPPSPTPTPTTAGVAISGFAFQPATLTIAHGTNVTWTNADGVAHTATSDAGAPAAFDTGRLGQDASGSFTFDVTGTYHYHCAIHGSMHGTITVA